MILHSTSISAPYSRQLNPLHKYFSMKRVCVEVARIPRWLMPKGITEHADSANKIPQAQTPHTTLHNICYTNHIPCFSIHTTYHTTLHILHKPHTMLHYRRTYTPHTTLHNIYYNKPHAMLHHSYHIYYTKPNYTLSHNHTHTPTSQTLTHK